MQIVRLVILIVLSITLTSCQAPQFRNHERKLVKIYDCEEDTDNIGFFICSVYCASHLYSLNEPARISETISLNPESCTDTVGFHVESWGTDITPTMKALKKFYSKKKR